MPSVRYEKSGAVGHIILCNPPHNLLNVEFYQELREAVVSATSEDLRAVLVRAEGPNFCGGGDPAVLPSLTPAAFRLLMTEYNQSFRALEALQVPTVAAVRGRVFGGGVELAPSCDFIVAARDAISVRSRSLWGTCPWRAACSGWRNGSAAHVRCSTRCSRFR